MSVTRTAILYRRDAIFSAPANATTGTLADPPTAAENAQLIVINAQVAAQSAYTGKDTTGAGGAFNNLEPRPVFVTIQKDAGTGSYIATFGGISGAPVTAPPLAAPARDHTVFPIDTAYAATPGAVAEGAFIVISDDRITTPGLTGRMNGRIFRIGNFRSDISPAGWELAPGYDFIIDPGLNGVKYKAAVDGGVGQELVKDDITALGVTGALPDGGALVNSDGPAVAFILGKGFADPVTTPTGAGAYAGTAQDVAIYTTFVPAK